MEQKAGLKFHYYWLWSQTGFSLFTFKTLTWHLNCARHCFKCITNNWLTHSLFQPCKIHYYHAYEKTGDWEGCHTAGEQWNPDSSPDSLAPDLLLTAHQAALLVPVQALPLTLCASVSSSQMRLKWQHFSKSLWGTNRISECERTKTGPGI